MIRLPRSKTSFVKRHGTINWNGRSRPNAGQRKPSAGRSIAIAVRTSRIRFGPMITPLSRRRPWKLARECVTVDRLSNGRLIFTAGMGAATDDGGFHKVGEAMDLKIRAQLVDEGLYIMDALWKGQPVTHAGEHYRGQKKRHELPPAVPTLHRPAEDQRFHLIVDTPVPIRMGAPQLLGDATCETGAHLAQDNERAVLRGQGGDALDQRLQRFEVALITRIGRHIEREVNDVAL